MKAIILAAGKGTRVSRMIQDVPKSTLPIDGTPLIRLTVDLLIKYGIEPIVCVGYKRNIIFEALKGLNVKSYFNPFYDVTNSIASLWFAREELDEDILILNADVYFNKEILELILKDPRDMVMAIDKSRTISGDFFFSLTGDGCINKYGKELPLQERNCEYVGIAKVNKNYIDEFSRRLEKLISTQRHQLWWENILYSFSDEKKYDIFTIDVDGLFWSEIDYFDDYERILKYISQDEKNKSYE